LGGTWRRSRALRIPNQNNNKKPTSNTKNRIGPGAANDRGANRCYNKYFFHFCFSFASALLLQDFPFTGLRPSIFHPHEKWAQLN
jgi:hypothetical protein